MIAKFILNDIIEVSIHIGQLIAEVERPRGGDHLIVSTSQITDVPPVRFEVPIANKSDIERRNPLNRAARLEQAFPALIFLVSLAYLSLFRHFSTRDLDEGIILQAAERVLRGQIPYRDFFLFYTPGSVCIQAALFKLFGDSLVVARMGIAFVGAVCSTIAYCLARRVCSRRISLLAAGLTAALSVTYRFVVVHNWYSTLFATLALYAAVRLLESGDRSWAFMLGSLAALTTLIEQSKGGALCGGLVLAYVILQIGSSEKRRNWSNLPALGLGFIWPWVLTFLYFGANKSVGVMFQDWLWPLYHYTQANHVFYGHLSWAQSVRDSLYTEPLGIRIWEYLSLSPLLIVPLLPLVATVWFAFWTHELWKRRTSSPDAGYYVLMSAVSLGLLLCILIVRTDITDFMYQVPVWYVVLAWILQPRNTKYRLLQKFRPYLLVYVCVAFGMMSFALLLGVNSASVRTETRRGILMTVNQETVIPAIQARVPAGSELLVYPYLPLYNYLTATHSPARVDYFQVGMSTSEQAQDIIQSLQTQNTRWILFDPGFAERIPDVWPNTPINLLANDSVSEYIARQYHVCQVLKAGASLQFQLMVRQGEKCTRS